MRLVQKIILFIHQLLCGHFQSASLVFVHTFQSSAAIVCSIPGTKQVGYTLRPALQPFVCLPLTPSGNLSLLILFFELKRIRKVREQVTKEAAASS